MQESHKIDFMQYKIYLIDLYGVVHNGKAPFPKALRSIQRLLDHKKKIIFFSNSPRTIEYVQEQLNSMNIDLTGIKIITSGEHYLYALKHYQDYEMPFLAGNAFIMKNHHNNALFSMDILRERTCDKLNQANYIVIAGYTSEKNELNLYNDVMQEAIGLNLPAICPNPDLVAYIDNTPIYTGGTFAKLYEEMGGEVHYFGKPTKSFYELALNLYVGHHYSKKEILGIGDNIETEIIGAKNFGIDSLLIKKTGLCKKYDDTELLEILKKRDLQPIIIDEFEI